MTEQDKRNIEAVRRMYRGETQETATIAPDTCVSMNKDRSWKAGGSPTIKMRWMTFSRLEVPVFEGLN